MKDSVRILSEKLEAEPTVPFRSTDDSIDVEAQSPNGFPVHFADYGEEQVVSYGGWHDHFKDSEEAIRCFLFGLSSQCRLKVDCCGEFEFRWTVQSFDDGEWIDADTTGMLFYPFWRKRKIKYLNNEFVAGV